MEAVDSYQYNKELLKQKFSNFISELNKTKKLNINYINTIWFQEFPYNDFGTITFDYDEKNNILHLVKLIMTIRSTKTFDIHNKSEVQYLNDTFFGKKYLLKTNNNDNNSLNFDFSSLNKYKFDV